VAYVQLLMVGPEKHPDSIEIQIVCADSMWNLPTYSKASSWQQRPATSIVIYH